MSTEADNLRIQLKSARQIAEAFREDARVHRERCAVLENEIKALKAMMKRCIVDCACCCHADKLRDYCQFCRRFTGMGEDMWEV